jgi:hypothetical protein
MRWVLCVGLAGVFVGCGDDSKPQPPGGGGDMTTSMMAPDVLRVSSFALKYAQSGSAFSYRATLSKPGQAAWSLKSAPSGATIDATSGSITWTPNDSQGGGNDFTVHADLNGESAEQQFRVQVAVIKLEASQAVDPANPNGGTVSVDAPLSPVRGSAIAIQPGALPPGNPVTLTISSVQNLPAPPLAGLAGLGASDLTPVEFGPSGTAFAKPVSLYLPLPQTVLAKGNPVVQTFDYATNRWSAVPVLSIDATGGVIVASAPHFTPFVTLSGVKLYDLGIGLGGAQCSQQLLVKAPLAVTFAQLPASAVNGYMGAATDAVSDVLTNLPAGRSLQVLTTFKAQTGDKTGSNDTAYLLASAQKQMDGSYVVAVSSDQHKPISLSIPPTLAAADVEAWLNGSRADALIGGLGMGLASGATVTAELSLYVTDGAPQDRPLGGAAAGAETSTVLSLGPVDGYDSDCDQAPDAYDPTPMGNPPPSLVGAPASIGVTVGTGVMLHVMATGSPMLAWSASDPSVMVTPSADGLSATATPTLAGQFHVDVVGTSASGTASFSFALTANPPQMAPLPPPFVALSASSNSVKSGGKITLNAFGKSPQPLTFKWTGQGISATSGDTVVFSAVDPGNYTITCTGNDGTQDSMPASVTLSVLAANANQPPPSPVVTPMSALLQHGAGQGVMAVVSAQAVDPDGDAVTYDFAPDPANPAGFMLVKNGSSATFYSGTDGVYVFYVTATDSHGAVSPWTVIKLQVSPTLPPAPVDADHDGYWSDIDCNDNDPTIHPGAKEICGDGIDQDCKGGDLTVGDCDADGDRYSLNQLDCDDNNPARNPGAVERCDGVDNNCNGQTDEGFAVGQGCTAGVGACASSGTQVCNAALNGTACNAVAGTPKPETCNGIDDDCNGKVDDVAGGTGGDVNNCGGCNIACNAPANESAACTNGGCSYTCQAGFVDTDKNAANGCECQITNGGVEICDGIDNDCNGIVDDNTAQVFYDGPAGTLGVGICKSGVKSCVGGSLQITQPEIVPGPEVCNGIDDNCDGHVDETFALGMDDLNCGKCGFRCAAGTHCTAGMCMGAAPADMGMGGTADMASGCGMGQMLCPSGCSNLTNDNQNCGACNKPCGSGTFCMGVTCMPIPGDMAAGGPADMSFGGPPDLAHPPGDMGMGGGGNDIGGPSCPGGFTSCAGGCEYPPKDPGNCGACGNVCGAGTTCLNGTCVSSSGAIAYGGHCTQNTDCAAGLACFDQNTFGFPGGFCAPICDNARTCSAGFTCQPYQTGTAGSCLPSCAVTADCTQSGFMCIHNICQPDCRMAGNYCHAGQTCQADGTCGFSAPVDMGASSCSNGWSSCGSSCEYLTDDPHNCGTCGNSCAGVCAGGSCAAAGAGAFGGACAGSTDCAAGLFCMDQARFNMPGGFCGQWCDSARPCPGSQKCMPTNGSGSSGVCFKQCMMDADCGRAGYICQGGTCQGGCTANPSQCGPGTVCDSVSNHCLPGTQNDMGGTCIFQCSGACGGPDGCGGTCQPGSGCLACPAGYSVCNGECISLADDPKHCGNCMATACGGTQVCQGSVCQTGGAGAFSAACTANTDCSGGATCLDQARFSWPGGYCTQFCDPMNPCPGAGTQMCLSYAGGQQGGVCVQKCAADGDCAGRSGYICNGYCQPDCRVSPGFCSAGQQCDQATGRCGSGAPVDMGMGGGCGAPNMLCNAICTNVMFDSNNCGNCGNVCGAGTSCNNGMCQSGGATDMGGGGCMSPNLLCNAVCINPQFDNNNCGGCNNKCNAGQTCNNGMCQSGGPVDMAGGGCMAPNTLCNAICTNTRNDNNNCGGCGMACAAGQNCMNSICQGGAGPGPLSITTHNFNIMVNDTFAVVASGGSGSYTWSVLSGPGSFTAGNTYNAGPTTGTATLQVNDGTNTATITAQVFSTAPVIFSPAGGLISSLNITLQSAVHCSLTSGTWAGQSLNPPAMDQYGSLTGPLPGEPDGTYTLTANVSCPGATGMGSTMYTVDRTPPSMPLITTPTQDGTLAGPSVQVVGTAEANSHVDLNDNNFGPIGSTQADGAGNWTINTTNLLTGQHLISASARDQAGNTSVPSTTILFTVTGGNPGPLTAVPANSQEVVNASFRMIATGGTPPYTWAAVNIQSGGVITAQGAYTAGNTPGTDTVSVSDSASASVQATVTVVAPLSVTITSPMNNAQLTQGQQVTVQGHTAPMAQLTLHVDAMQGPAGSSDPAGNFSINVPTQLSLGAHTIQVGANQGGNTGSASINVTVVAPAGPNIQLTSPVNGAMGVANPVTLTGTSDPMVSVTVFLDGVQQGAPFNSNGSWSLPLMQTLSSGMHTWSASGTNGSGTTNTATFNFTVP